MTGRNRRDGDRPFLGQRSIGGPVPARNIRRFTAPAFPTGTLSGAIPNSIPPAVETDALRMLLARHAPGTNGRCACGDPLGEETGHCRIGRAALVRLLLLKARQEDEPDDR